MGVEGGLQRKGGFDWGKSRSVFLNGRVLN
jgi:hypothetical protein